jgi:hypothetical protein
MAGKEPMDVPEHGMRAGTIVVTQKAIDGRQANLPRNPIIHEQSLDLRGKPDGFMGLAEV